MSETKQFKVKQGLAQTARSELIAALDGSDVDFHARHAAYVSAVGEADEAFEDLLAVRPNANVVAGIRFAGTPGVGMTAIANARIVKRLAG